MDPPRKHKGLKVRRGRRQTGGVAWDEEDITVSQAAVAEIESAAWRVWAAGPLVCPRATASQGNIPLWSKGCQLRLMRPAASHVSPDAAQHGLSSQARQVCEFQGLDVYGLDMSGQELFMYESCFTLVYKLSSLESSFTLYVVLVSS